MRYAVALLIMFIALPASAGERLPWIDKQVGVPEPIPADMCVRVIWNKVGRAKIGFRVSQFEPPLSTKDIQALELYRSKNWGKLEPCAERRS